MPDDPLISIIVPYFNCPEVGACLASLRQQSYGNSEIIVVNNNSSKKYLALLHAYPVRIVHETVQSSYAARNRGIRCAHGDYLAFIDADCIADKDWIMNLWKTGREQSMDMVLGNVIKTVSNSRRGHEYVDRDIYHDHRRLFLQSSGTTANLFVSKKVIDRFGGFSTAHFSGNDTLFINALVESGVTYAYADSAVVFHRCRKTLVSLMAKGFRTGVADGNKEAARLTNSREKIKYLRRKCWALLNPLRSDIIQQAQLKSLPYAASYFMHFAAHGLGRALGITNLPRTALCKKVLRYT